MATYRQVYLIMRARDDASRIMRGLGTTMGHLNKQNEKFNKANEISEQNYRNAIKRTGDEKTRFSKVARNAHNVNTAGMSRNIEQETRLQRQMSTRNAVLSDMIKYDKKLDDAGRARAKREMSANTVRSRQAAERAGLYREEINASKRATDARVRGIESVAEKQKTEAIRTRAHERDEIARGKAQITRLQNTQGMLMGVGQAGIIMGGLMAAGGLAASRALFRMADASAEFSNKNRVAISVAKDFRGSVSDLGDAVLDVAREVPVPIEDLQDTFYYTFSALDVGLKSAKELVRGFANEAVVGNANIADAARSSIAMINAYSMDVSTAAATTETLTRIQDMQFNTVKWGALTYQDLSTNIGKIIPAATRAGQEVEMIGGMLAFLTRQGLSAEMAATSAARAMELISEARVVSRLERMGITMRDSITGEMRAINDIAVDLGRHLEGLDPAGIENVMQALAPLDGDESQKYQNMLREADDVTKALSGPERTAALHQIFMGAGNRIQARRFWDLALKNYDELNRLTTEITNGSGEFSRALTLAWEEPAVAIGIYENEIDALKITIGEELIPVKLMLLDVVLRLVDKWNALDEGVKESIITFIGYAAPIAAISGIFIALTAVLALVTSMLIPVAAALVGTASAVKVLMTAMALGMGIPAVLGAIVGALILLIAHWDAVVEGFKAFITIGGRLDEPLEVIALGVLSLTTVVVGMTAAWGTVGPVVAAATAQIKLAEGALVRFGKANPYLLLIIATLTALAGIVYAVSAKSRELSAATRDYTDSLRSNNQELLDNAGSTRDLMSAIDELNRKQLVQRLNQEGAFDEAKKFGISQTELTDAIMGNERAIDSVNDKLVVNSSAWDRVKNAASLHRNEQGQLIISSMGISEAMDRESQAMQDAIPEYIALAQAAGGVESQLATILQIQMRGGPQDSAEQAAIQRLKQMIVESGGLDSALSNLPPEMQAVAAEAGLMAGGVDDASGEIKELSASAELLKGVLEQINDVEEAFGNAGGQIIASLREVHEQALESGDMTDDAFQQISESAITNADIMAGAWIENLRLQEEEHNQYVDNMETIIRRGGGEVIDILNNMGEESAGAIHVMANASDEEFRELERLLTGSASRTSDETVTQMEALKDGMTTAISEGVAEVLADFGQGMILMEAVAQSGGEATTKELSKQLGISIREVNRLSNQFGLGLAEGINPLLEGMGRDRVSLAQLRYQRGETITNLQRGGKLPGYGGGDIVPAMLEPGEFVLRKEAVKNLDPQSLHEFNAKGYQAGGYVSVDDVPKVPSAFGNYGTMVGHAGKETATHAREKVVEWLEENLAPALGGVGMEGQPPGVDKMMAALRTRFPGLPLYSGFRPGAITATGNPSYHGMGRAVDIPPRMDVNKWIADNYFAQTRELILSLSGATQIKNGRSHYYTGITRAMHFDHNHWAMQHGGIVQSPINALIGEAGPEAVIPLDRINALIRDALFEVIRTPGEAGKGALAQDQYTIILEAIGAVQGLDEARRGVEQARATVGTLRGELLDLRAANMQAVMDFERAQAVGKQMSLEAERDWIQAGIRVEELAENLERMRGATEDNGEFAQAQANLNAAQAELMRVNQILPSIEDPVARLLMQYEAESKVADARLALNNIQESSIPTARELRIAEIELAMAERDLAESERTRIDFTPEYYEAQERMRDLSEQLRAKQSELTGAVNSVSDAEMGNMAAVIGLMDATQKLNGLQPASVEFFRSIGIEAGLSADRINELLSGVHELNSVNIGSAAALRNNRGVDRRLLEEGNIQGIADRVRAIFENRGVSLSQGALPGESTAQRIARIVSDLISGRRSFDNVRRSVDRLATAHSGGITTQSGLYNLAPKEAIIPLPSGVGAASIGGGDTKIEISSGAVQITFEGNVGEGSSEEIRGVVDDALHELVEEIRRDRRGLVR